jgi:hypothetical protein
MTKKRWIIGLVVFAVLFFGSIFYRNITTYNSMRKHTGYAYGTIVKVWDDDGSWYSRYQYTVNGRTFRGRQGDKHKLTDTVLIVYDRTKPRFSMIATYPLNIVLDSNNRIVQLDTSRVSYKWSDYLPGDEVHSIKDLWSLD